MNNERIKDENREIYYLKLIENSIEICNDQIEAKKKIKAEIARQEAEEHRKKIRQKKLENERLEETKRLEEKQDRIKRGRDDYHSSDYYTGYTGWFLGSGLGFSTVTVKFPKVSQDLFGNNDIFEGNELKYSGSHLSVSVGEKTEKTRLYVLFDFLGLYSGGIEQEFNHNYTRSKPTNFSFNFDYFFNINNSDSNLFFIGGGFMYFKLDLILASCDNEKKKDLCDNAYWYRGSERIYLDQEIEISGSFPVARIGWHWGFDGVNYEGNNIELSYTHLLGTATGNGTFSVIRGSGLSSNPNAHGPYRGEFVIPPHGVIALIYNLYW